MNNKNFSVIRKDFVFWNPYASYIMSKDNMRRLRLTILELYPTAADLSIKLTSFLNDKTKKYNMDQIRSLKFHINELNEISKINDKEEQKQEYIGFVMDFIRDPDYGWLWACILSFGFDIFYLIHKRKKIDKGDIDKYIEKAFKNKYVDLVKI